MAKSRPCLQVWEAGTDLMRLFVHINRVFFTCSPRRLCFLQFCLKKSIKKAESSLCRGCMCVCLFPCFSRHFFLQDYPMCSILHSTGVCICIQPDFSGVKYKRHGGHCCSNNSHTTRRHFKVTFCMLETARIFAALCILINTVLSISRI